MRRVLHDDGVRRWLRLHIGLITNPPRGVVVESSAGRNHCPQVDPDHRRSTVGVELTDGIERGSFRQWQPQLAANPGSQRMVPEGRARDAIDDGALLPAAQDDGVDQFLWLGIGQGIKPEVLPVDGAPRVMARLAPPPGLRSDPAEQVILRTRGEDRWSQGGDRREWAGPPGDVSLLDREAAQDRSLGPSSIAIIEDVVGDATTQFVAIIAAGQRRRSYRSKPRRLGHLPV